MIYSKYVQTLAVPAVAAHIAIRLELNMIFIIIKANEYNIP
jgi:hypothetical protein